MASIRSKVNARHVIDEPEAVTWLLASPAAAWLWLLPRLLLGWHWVHGGQQKLVDPAWVQSGAALQDQWLRYLSTPDPAQPAISFDAYPVLVQGLLDARAYSWLAPVLAWSELVAGLALVLGAFTGIAAFCGVLIGWTFLPASSAVGSPLELAVAIGLLLAWRVAGYVGLDYFLLPRLGTPWSRQRVPAVPAPGGAGARTVWIAERDDR